MKLKKVGLMYLIKLFYIFFEYKISANFISLRKQDQIENVINGILLKI